MTPGPDPRVVLTLRRHAGGAPLFCVHPGSGFGLPYLALLPHLDQDVPVVALQARGLVSPEQAPTSLEEMTGDYLTQILRIQPTGPYRLLGWCIGGRVAFEIACRLRAAGAPVESLTLVSVLPPNGEPPPDAETILRDMLRSSDIDASDTEMDALCRLPLDFPALNDYLRRTGHPMHRLNETSLMRTYRNHHISDRLSRTPLTRTFDGDMLFVAPDRPGAVEFSAESWRPYVSGRIDFRRAPGRHAEMMYPDAARVIGSLVNDALHH
jgi:thioesterase domain-containing protein